MKSLLAILLLLTGLHLNSAQANPEGLKELHETANAKEILRCRQDLAAAQQRFDIVWESVLTKFSIQKEFLEELQSEHERWLHFRDEMAHTMGEMGIYAKYSPDDSSVFMERTAVYIRDRTKWLIGLSKQPGTDKNLSGVWWSSMGDSIRIDHAKNNIRFSYSATGGNGHTGITAGTIIWTSSKGKFNAQWGDSSNAERGAILFELENGLLRTKQEGTVSQSAGAGVTFESKFARVAPLSDKDRERIAYDVKFFGPP
jgi:hypothetical protein